MIKGIGPIGLAAMALCIAAPGANAATNLVLNGNFTSSTTGAAVSEQVVSPNSKGGETQSNWTNAGYTFVFTPGTADVGNGAIATEYPSNLKLWGPNDGGASSGTTLTSIPGGGNFVASDGGFETGPLTQVITGLTKGAGYALSFYWADAQQTSQSGATTDSWTVSFGDGTKAGTTTVSTGSVADVSRGFTPWIQATYSFVASSATQTLSFLAVGSPAGVPPFSLLSHLHAGAVDVGRHARRPRVPRRARLVAPRAPGRRKRRSLTPS